MGCCYHNWGITTGHWKDNLHDIITVTSLHSLTLTPSHQVRQQEAMHRAEVKQTHSNHQQELVALHKAHRHAMEGA